MLWTKKTLLKKDQALHKKPGYQKTVSRRKTKNSLLQRLLKEPHSKI